MTPVATAHPTPAVTHRALLPFGDPSRRRRLAKVGAWLGATALVVAALELVGVDVTGWFQSLWDSLTSIGFG